jgi:hypothetical protein
MAINPAVFNRTNVVDSCSIWNILSSLLLWSRARQAACYFSCTQFVVYECLHKKRSNQTPEDSLLQQRMTRELSSSGIKRVQIDLEDLQEVEILSSQLE